MITDKGKSLIAKYLAGQVSQPFSYLSLGAGGTPVVPQNWPDPEPEPIEFASRTNMVFESLRIPVSETSVVDENGETYVVLKGTVPSSGRFEFSEIGVFSDERDSLLTSTHSNNMLSFMSDEPWEEKDGSGGLTEIPYLESISSDDTAISPDGGETAFFTDASTGVLNHSLRVHGSTRVGSDALLVNNASNGIQLSHALFDLSRANATDEIKLALVVVPKVTGTQMTRVDSVTVNIKFKETVGSTNSATLSKTIINYALPSNDDQRNLTESGHVVVSEKFGNMSGVNTLRWDNVSFIEIDVSVSVNAGSPDDWYVALDSMRFDSNNNNNTAYGLVSYSVVQNLEGRTVVKDSGEQSEIEYRVLMAIDRVI